MINDANFIHKVYNITKPDIPLKAYHDLSSFKIYMKDVGLLRRMSGLDSSILMEGNKLFEEFKGSFVENYVLNKYKEKYHPTILAKILTNNLVKDGDTINIPLFLVKYMDRLLEES